MGYENGKIYILKCNDNHFYYGSTTVELKRRFWGHKHSSKTMSSKVYKQYVKEYRNKNKERINELKRQEPAKNKEISG